MDFQKIKEFLLNDLFQGYTDWDTTVFAICTFLAFLIGFIVSAISGARRRRKIKKELEGTRNELTNTKVEYAAMQEQFDLKTADFQKAELEIADLKNRLEIIETEKTQLHTDLYVSNEEIEKLNASSSSYANTIDDLNNQIIGLKSKVGEPREVGEISMGAASQMSIDKETFLQINQMQNSYSATLNRLVALEEKLNHLDVENELLKVELDKMKSGVQGMVVGETSTLNVEEASQSNHLLIALQEKVKSAVGTSLPASGGRKDDLTLIDGVGTFLEEKLNNLGITTYEQIASFDEDMVENVTEAIEYFPGRIKKDDWVGQALRLAEGMTTERKEKDASILMSKGAVSRLEIESTEEENTSKIKEDDLQAIEGIGPKIAELLTNAGVNTWQKLADSSVEDLKTILLEGGNRFKMHDPSSWSQQAQFAANRNWEKLKEYQDYLVGGRDKG